MLRANPPFGRLCCLLCCALAASGAVLCGQENVLILTPGPAVTSLTAGRPAGPGTGAAAPNSLAAPSALAYDGTGNLYVADTRNHVIRRVSAAGVVSTVVGTDGQQGFAGDGGPATAALLDSPSGVAVATDGTVYVADSRNHRVRKLSADGTISTIAGTGVPGFTGDGGPAMQAALRNPTGLAFGLAGELYIADTGNHRVRRLARDGTMGTVAGSGVEGAAGDGGLATAAGLDSPAGVAVRADGALLVADRMNGRVRVVTADGLISSLPQSSLALRRPAGVAVDALGDVLIADSKNYRIQQVSSLANGQGVAAGVVLGSGEQGAFNPAAGPLYSPMGLPSGLAADAASGFAISDRDNAQVQHLSLATLVFADTPVGQQSPLKQVVFRNASTHFLTVNTLTLPGGFVRDSSSTCAAVPLQINAGTSCTVAVAFAPVAENAQSGLLVAEVDGGLPQRIFLSGNGLRSGTALPTTTTLRSAGGISYAGVTLTLSAAVLSSGSAAATGTVTFFDAASAIGSVAITGGTAQISTASLTVGQHALSAQYSGDLHSAASTSAALAETVVPAPDFSWSADASRLSMQAGAAGTMSLTLQPLNGTLNQAVTLQVDGLPAGSTSSLSPLSLVLAGNPVSVVLTMQLPASAGRAKLIGTSSGGSERRLNRLLNGHPGDTLQASLGLIAGLAAFRWRRRMPWLAAGTVCLGLAGLSGCSGGFLTGASTSAQSVSHTYPITVTASANGVTGTSIVHQASFTLVVTP